MSRGLKRAVGLEEGLAVFDRFRRAFKPKREVLQHPPPLTLIGYRIFAARISAIT